MAKRKTTKKKSGKRSGSGGRKMGALSLDKDQNLLMMAAGVVGGAIAKKFIDTVIAKQDTINVEQKTIDGLEVVGAAVGFYMIDSPFLRGAFLGIGTAAAVSGLQQMDVLKGSITPMVPFRPRPLLNGVTQTPAVAAATNTYGFPKASTVAGSYSRYRAAAGS